MYDATTAPDLHNPRLSELVYWIQYTNHTIMHWFSVCLFPIEICATAKIASKWSMPAEGSLGCVLWGPACNYVPVLWQKIVPNSLYPGGSRRHFIWCHEDPPLHFGSVQNVIHCKDRSWQVFLDIPQSLIEAGTEPYRPRVCVKWKGSHQNKPSYYKPMKSLLFQSHWTCMP